MEVTKLLDSGKTQSSKDARHILSKSPSHLPKGSDADVPSIAGEAGSGKSVLLLQSAAHALQSGWIVLYIPRGQYILLYILFPTSRYVVRGRVEADTHPSAAEWIQSASEYKYHPSSKSFHQSALASTILNTLITVNSELLSTIKSSSQIGTSATGTSLVEVCRNGAKSEESVQVLQAVLGELAQQTQYPVLLAIDEVQALFSTSEVRTPDYSILESYHLSTPSLILDYLTGKETLVSPSSHYRLPPIMFHPYLKVSFNTGSLSCIHPQQKTCSYLLVLIQSRQEE